jgi:GNAT superfamily N-acetyltransferase
MTTDRQHRFRRAEPREASALEALQSRSASHWDYPDGYFDWAGDALEIPASYVRDNPVHVLMDATGSVLGFYSLTEETDDALAGEGDQQALLLDRMFLDPDQIGRGLGRVLWEHAVDTAVDLGASELVIAADPNAAPFYDAMGARWYTAKPTEEPTWTIQVYRHPLRDRRAST